jgi:hypothetical protein
MASSRRTTAVRALVASLTLAGCSVAPQLAPSAAGCYRVAMDSFPDAYAKALVPPPPELVRLDTAFGGQLAVPVAWLEAAGYRQRAARVGLGRAFWTIRDGVLGESPSTRRSRRSALRGAALDDAA